LNELSGEMNDMRSAIQKKKDQFKQLTEQMDEVICNYDKETESLKGTLHTTRDEQVFLSFFY